MAKNGLVRYIDQRGGFGAGSGALFVVASSLPETPRDGLLYVGRVEGPHVGMWRLPNDAILFQAVDVAGVPYFTVGTFDPPEGGQTNRTWWTLGYPGFPGIRLPAATSAVGQPEQWRGIEVDAETLVGTIPGDTLPFTGTPTGSKFLRDDLSWQTPAGGGGGGASTFLELTDTPANYTGQGGKFVAVKSDGSGLEFVASPEVGGLSFSTLDVELSSVDWAIA
jgi:hypothetical protein